MKKRGLVIILIFALLMAGWWGFRRWQMYNASVWKLLPENSFFVVQSKHLQDSTYQVQKGGIDLREVPLLNLASRHIDQFKLLSDNASVVSTLLKDKQITYVLQKTPSNKFVYLSFLPLDAFANYDWLEGRHSSKVRVTSHTHSSQRIYDVSNYNSEPLFAYTFFNNFLVSCTSGDVLEDWVRYAQSPLRATNTSRLEDNKKTTQELSIYIDSQILSEALQRDAATAADAGLIYFLSFLPSVEALHLEPLYSTKNPTLISKSKRAIMKGYVQALNDQKAFTFKNTFYVSNNTAVMYRLGFENSAQFIAKLRPQLDELSSNSINESRQELYTLLGNARMDTFYRYLDREVISCQLEPNNVRTNGLICLQQIKPNEPIKTFIRRLSILFNKDSGVPFEPFQGDYVYTINWPELPAVLFGGLFKGFPKCYIAFHKNFIVYANDEQVLKDYLVDLEYQRTWGNSSLSKNFLEKTLGPSNFTFVLNPRKSKSYMGDGYLSYLFNNLNYDVSEKIPFDQLVFQAAYKKERVYSALTFGRLNKATSSRAINKVFLQQEIPLETPPIGNIYTVKNYPTGLDKTLISTATYELINPTLKEPDKRKIVQLDAPIVGDIHSVDFLSIGRLQYIFATEHSLYIIDEDDQQRYQILPLHHLPKGHSVRSFQRLESGIEGSYRFLIIDDQGYLYLWNSPNQPPVVINKSRPFIELLLPVHEVEYQGKRHFLFTQAKGQVGLISTSGVVPPPYKLDLKTRFSGPFFGVFDPEKGITTLLGVSKYGELFDITLDGKISNKSQLFRSDPTTFFRAQTDANNRDWILFRESETQYTVLDKKGNELFTAKGLIADQKNVQYHFLGADIQLLSVKSGSYTTLYDLKGNQIGDKPIPSDIPIRISWVEGYNKLLIYSYFDKKLQSWSLKIR